MSECQHSKAKAMIGETLGHYRILEKLGSGGMGDVFRARDLTLGRQVAVKVMPDELASDPARLRRFEQEARTASALNHPNIVHIYEVGQQGSTHYLAMELVTGKTLRELLTDGPWLWETLLPVARQLAAGVSKAHEAGIVHRDLKPENVMVTDDGYVKILDFGLAKLLDLPSAKGSEIATLEKRATTPGTILGTVGHMSPEQARGEPADHRSDQFALGTLLYEMVAGENPFERPTAIQTLSAVIEAAPKPLHSLGLAVPAEFCALVDRLLEKEPSRRYPSTGELVAGLARLDEHPPAGAVAARAERKRQTVVGRKETMAELSDGLRFVEREGRGLLLGVAGEGGGGKSTVVEAFLEEVTARSSLPIARGRCSERLAGTEAYLPFLEGLESLLRGDRDGSLARLMKDVAPSWYFHLKPTSSDDGSRTRASSQERMKREVSVLLERLSEPEPLIVFIEDLHWADVSTVDLLAHLADRFDAVRTLIMTTYRPEELRLAKHAFLDVRSDLKARGSLREIALPFLSREDVEQYLAREFPEHRFPEELSSIIHGRTEGSPLFMVDLLRYLRDQGVLAEEEGVFRLARSIPELDRELPQSVQGMIERKLDRLSEPDRRLLQAASVQGDEFHAAVLAEVLEQDPADVEDGLGDLERVHALVQPLEEEELPDGTFTVRYRFVHVLYQNVLYAALRPTRRSSWSRSIADTLLSHFGDEAGSIASELAVLLETARDRARAAKFYGMAAQNAARVFAYREAVVLSRRGLALAQSLPDSSDRAQLELTLRMTLGPALVTTQGYASSEVGENFGRARELCRTMGETAELFPVLHGLYRYFMVRSEPDMMLELAEELKRLAEREHDPELLVPAYRALGTAALSKGLFEEAGENLREGYSLYQSDYQDSFVRLYGQDEGLICLEYLSWVLWYLGYPDQSDARNDEILALARKQSNPYVQVHLLSASLFYRVMRREPSVLLEEADPVIALSKEHGFALWVAWATKLRGWALAQRGHHEEGIRQIRQGSENWRAAGAKFGQAFDLALLAEAYLGAGQVEEGLRAVDQALSILDHPRYWEAEVHRLKGELVRMKDGDDSEAEASLERALQVARAQKSRSFELRAAMSLSRLWKEQDKREEARRLLGDIYGWFTEGFDTPDLVEAKALLAELS